MKPAWPEQIQDTHGHDYTSLGVSKLKKYKQMKKVIFGIAIVFALGFSLNVDPSARRFKLEEFQFV